MARYLRRLSLIAYSFWFGCALQREYTMGQPLKYSLQNDLQKCPVENNFLCCRPSVCVDVISLVASSCGYTRGAIEPRVAQSFTAQVATQRGRAARPPQRQ